MTLGAHLATYLVLLYITNAVWDEARRQVLTNYLLGLLSSGERDARLDRLDSAFILLIVLLPFIMPR